MKGIKPCFDWARQLKNKPLLFVSGDVEYKPYVSATPDIEEITLNGTEDFLILACDGLWDFVSERDASNAVYEQLQQNAGECFVFDLSAVKTGF